VETLDHRAIHVCFWRGRRDRGGETQ